MPRTDKTTVLQASPGRVRRVENRGPVLPHPSSLLRFAPVSVDLHAPACRTLRAACGSLSRFARLRFPLSGFRFLLLLLCFSLTAQAGDILRGGATSASGRKATDARANAGAQAAEIAKTKAADRLARTTKILNDMRQMQSSARAAGSPLTVPDGLVPGGLERLPGGTWTGANLPSQSGSSVNIKQTASQALLDWKTFNVGKNTTLNFDQSAGGTDSGKWIAFNKVFDPSGVPSKILGKINADGQVYVINQNGIIFGSGSQVNARTLVASSLPINDNLIARGLLNQEAGNVQFLFSGLPADGFDRSIDINNDGALVAGTDYIAYQRSGDVVAGSGASLSSPVTAEGYGGRIMLVGKNVRNAGVLATPAGQTVLAAGLQVGIDAHSTSDPSLRGLDVYVGGVSNLALGAGGTAENSGLIEAARGSILMSGKHVLQKGVLESSSSVDLNGRIDLVASYDAVSNASYNPATPSLGGPFLLKSTGFVEMESSSLLRILPEWSSGKTIAASALPLRSQISVQAQTIHTASGSTLLAPNALVNFGAGKFVFESGATKRSTFIHSGGQIYLDANTIIDVSGSTDVFVPLSHSIMTLQLRGSELADSPLQRSASLRAVELTMDMRQRGSFYGREWVGTPLGDVTGYLNLIDRDVAQLTLEGGDINLRAGGSVVIRSGAVLDASGGYARNEGGKIQTTRLKLGQGLLGIEEATPDRIYDGIYEGKSTRSSEKWGVSKTFLSPLAPLGSYPQKQYISGANAGHISISAPSMALDGEMAAGRIIGPQQLRVTASSSSLPSAGSLNLRFEAQEDNPARSVNKFGLISPTPPTITFGSGFGQSAPADFSILANDGAPPISADRIAHVALDPALLDDDRFGSLTIRNSDGVIEISSGTTLATPAGGSLDFTAANIFARGNVSAPGGSVRLVAYTFSPYRAGFLSGSAGDILPPADLARGIIELSADSYISAAGQIHDDRRTSLLTETLPIVLNGGSVSMEAFDIRLAAGSAVDVSSGGVYASNGKTKFGSGGSISILAGQDPGLSGIIGGHLEMRAALSGFSGKSDNVATVLARLSDGPYGGSLTIKAPLVQIGGISPASGVFHVEPSFFNQGGFSQFELIGIGATSAGQTEPGLLISPGTVIEPVVSSRNSIPFGPGGRLAFPEIIKPVALRDPISLTFRSLGAVDNLTSIPLVRGDLVMSENSRISTDPEGTVQLIGQTVLVMGMIEAPGGSIVIKGAGTFPEVTKGEIALPTVFIAPSARLSAAGTAVLLPDPYGRRRGYVLPGGHIEVSGNILAASGSVLDVSGASGLLDMTPAELGLIDNPQTPTSSAVNAVRYSLAATRTLVESDGGIIDLVGSKLLISDATLLGKPGGPTALGGLLSVSSGRYVAPNTAWTTADTNLIVEQSGEFLPTALAGIASGGGNIFDRFQSFGNTLGGDAAALAAYNAQMPNGGTGFFAADKFQKGGFSSLELGGNVCFKGPVRITADLAIFLAEGGGVESDAAVSLKAPYIRIGQPFPLPLLVGQSLELFTKYDTAGNPSKYNPAPTSGPGNLSLEASLFDIGTTVLRGISSAHLLAAGGDIRGNGAFVMAGDLKLAAGQIYPTTAGKFDIFSYDNTLTGATGSVTIQGAGPRPLPLSAGGSLRVMASLITQGGTLRAPLGTISLGWDGIVTGPVNDVVGNGVGAPSTPVTKLLTMAEGSVTSVSAIDPLTGAGILIPYGMSPDGLTWIDPTGLDVTLAGLVPKGVSLGGQNIVTAPGSTIDVRGGGDLYAYRWGQGIGGFEDILADQDSYAIVPGYSLNYSPYAPFNTSADDLQDDPGYVSSSLGVGGRITLKGSEALPAGTYTLLPARYALLPGAVLITPFRTLDIGSGDPAYRYQFTTPGNVEMEDGSYLVSGRISNGLAPSRGTPAAATTFRVLSHDSVREISDYQDFYANDFLKAAALKKDQTSQRLPGDAGNVQIFSSAGLNLSGAVLAQAAAGARGGSADISAPGKIFIAGGGATPLPGDVNLSASGLSSWGVESLLIGGSRNGSNLSVRSSSVTVDTRGSSLSGPEVILAATGGLTLANNAQVASTGKLSQPGAAYSLTGDGALLRVSGDAGATISRTGFLNSPGVSLNVGDGAIISGNGVTLDSTYGTALSPTALIMAETVNLNSGRISILLDNPGAVAPAFGLVLQGSALASLASAGTLNLLSYSSLDFYGNGLVPFGNPAELSLRTGAIRAFNTGGNNITISAGDLLLDNSQGATDPGAAALLPGSLIIDVATLRVGTGSVGASGFADLAITATGGILGVGTGGLSTQGDLTIITPVVAAASSAKQYLTAAGDFVMTDPGTTAAFESGLGASYDFTGKTVAMNSDITLPSGSMRVVSTALTGGGISINGLLDVSGRERTFFDVSRFTDGGEVALSAASGDIAITGGGINVSAPAGGANAGTVKISTPGGRFTIAPLASIAGSAGTGGNGGSFDLDAMSVGSPVGIDQFNASLDAGGFNHSRSFRVRNGDVTLAGSSAVRNFSLFVDQGDLTVTGSINAKGTTGGSIHLASHKNLTIATGALLTVEGDDFNSAGKGGTVVLEAGTSSGGVAGTGLLTVAIGSKIDLSVLSKDATGPGTSALYGEFTGTLHLRAPQNAAANNLSLLPINGFIEDASSIVVEGFKVTNLNNSAGSQISAAVTAAVMTNGNTFGAATGNLATPGSMTAALLANNSGLESLLVIVPGAEIVNPSGSLTLASDWNLATYRFGPKLAPGVLTIRAAGDLVLQGSLSDGFNGGTSLWLSPLMANNASLPMNAQTWSYRLTAGADTGSAKFSATGSGSGSIKLGKDYGNAVIAAGGATATTESYVATRYQAIRTGSGSISLSAAADIQLLNQFAVIYTAGTRLAAENSIFAAGDFEIPHLVPDAGPTTVSDTYVLGKQQQITTAKYSAAGGDITLAAGNDIAHKTVNSSGLIDDSSRQLPMNWLYRRSYVDPETGEYGRSGVRFTTSGSRYVNDPSSSTTWWVDFSNFFEGIGTLGGGNIAIAAGRDILNIDAVAPTNARAPRGVVDASLIVEMGGGDVAITAGRNLSGGVYYVERGSGTIKVGGEITTNKTRSLSQGIVANLNSPTFLDSSTWLPTTLFTGRGGFDVSARGDVLLGPTANVFLLPQGIGNKYWYKTYFNTYGEQSYLNVASVGGDVTFRLESNLPSSTGSSPILNLWMQTQSVWSTGSTGATSNKQPWLRLSESTLSPFATVFALLPPNLSASALSGSVQLIGDVTLFPARLGGLEIVAAGSIEGLGKTGLSSSVVSGSQTSLWTSSTINVSDADPLSLPGMTNPFAYYSTVSRDTTKPPQADLPNAQVTAETVGSFLSFITTAFDESGSYSGAYALTQTKQALHAAGLLHAGDADPIRMYSASGDISGLTLYSPKAARIAAGNDIGDIAIYIQNVDESDISLVSAGRDLIASNPNSAARQVAASSGNALALGDSTLAGDIQISGPGALQVLAGGDIDLGTEAAIASDLGVGITSVGNVRNPYLPFTGADLYVISGLDAATTTTDSFLDEYLDKYQTELEADDTSSLSESARTQLAMRLLGLVLRDSGREGILTDDYSPGYDAIQALFGTSSSKGNINVRARDIRTKSGGEIVAYAPGGSVILSSDSITVAKRPTIASFAGTDGLMLVSESASSSTPAGIVTEYGGNISIFTEQNVEIGNGRIFTLRGGNIVIWSSEGDIAAGAASKTVATAPPTRVLIDPVSATIESDLSGLATGGGIGVLSTVQGVEEGDVDLIAPKGTIDAGDAGIRASGNLNIAAAQVLNADNISAGGTSQGVPSAPTVAAPNVSGLSSGSSSTAAASNAANSVSNQASQQTQEIIETPSTITVEVLGYGGGDEEEKEG